MIGFRVSINRKQICTAGVGDDGVLTTVVTWVGAKRHPKRKPPTSKCVDIHIGGLANDEHTDWIDGFQTLQVGDTVTIRIVETSDPDPPIRTQPSIPSPGAQCGFCGAGPTDDRELIFGPIVPICSDCVYACQRYLYD